MRLTMLSSNWAIVALLAMLHFLKAVSPATIEPLRLVGDSNNYINIKSTKPHVLQCTFRAGYDDPVRTVNWYKDNRLAYSWIMGQTLSSAYGVLNGYVATSGDKSTLQNLNFDNRVSLNLSGNYTCEVDSALGKTRSEPFQLVILDVPSENYITNVTLLSDVLPENETSSSEAPANCTLLWNFKTPAIFPKPNVTCGYYSYLHDDVTNSVPAGLTMHLLRNGSWQASFDHTPVQIAEIPRERRLGCSVSVPNTNYKKVVKFEDNFVIDHLIDSVGCPSFFLDPMYKLKYSLNGAVINCRGELEPTSTGVPIKVIFWCDREEFAVFPNGTTLAEWSDEISCNPTVMAWSRNQGQNGMRGPSSVVNISEALPMCARYSNGGQTFTVVSPAALAIGYLILFLGSFVLLH